MLLSLTLSLVLTQSSLALGGLDPLELSLGDKVPGKESLEVQWGRYTYRFGGESTRDAFLAQPENWAIQWGGACARMGPLGDRGDTERYAVVGAKIYVFASDECRATFLKGTERFMARVQLDWPQGRAATAGGRNWIEKAAVAHGSEVFDGKGALRLARTSEAGGWSRREELLIGKAGEVRRALAAWKTSEGPGQAVETAWVLGPKPFTVEEGQVFDLLSAAEREDVLRYAHRQPLYLLWARRQPGFRVAQFEPQEGDTHVRIAAELVCREKVSALPVLRAGSLVGIVTSEDLLWAFLEGAEDPEEEFPG